MNVTVTLDNLRDALRTTKPGVGKHMPALAGVLIDASDEITATTTDLDVRITTPLAHERIAEAGTVLIPHDRLSKLVAGMGEGPVQLTLDGTDLMVESGAVSANLRVLDKATFPKPRPLTDGTEWKLDEWECIVRTLHARDGDPAQGAKACLQIAEGWAFATDGYRLAQARTSVEQTLCLPVSPFLAANNTDGVVVLRAGASVFELESAGTTWQASVSPSEVIPRSRIDQLFPVKPPLSFRVDREELTQAVRLVGAVGAEQFTTKNAAGNEVKTTTSLIRLTLDDNTLTVTGREQDVGSAEVRLDASCKGEVTVAFNAGYFAAMLGACEDDNLTMHGVDNLKPWVAEDADLSVLIMPVRVTS